MTRGKPKPDRDRWATCPLCVRRTLTFVHHGRRVFVHHGRRVFVHHGATGGRGAPVCDASGWLVEDHELEGDAA